MKKYILQLLSSQFFALLSAAIFAWMLLTIFPAISPSFAGSLSLSIAEQDQLTRLKATGYGDTPRVYIRIFKEEKRLEVWVGGAKNYKLFRNYPICNFSGVLGPKISEGDKQAPEGFYHVPADAVFWNSAKWPRAINLAFPNVYDAVNKRTGSTLLIHGGCSSKGCYALKDGPMEQIYALVSLAAKKGQKYFPIHIFPFRFSEQNWRRHKWAKSYKFWQTLQPVYERFNKTRRVPEVLVCGGQYEMPLIRGVIDDERLAYNRCVRPVPIGSVSKIDVGVPQWVLDTARDYPALAKRRKISPDGPRIKVTCNLKRVSCKKWLALRKRMLAKGTLPKNLLKAQGK